MLTIAWDVDDTLNDLMYIWFEEWWRSKHPDCRLSYEDLTENPPHRLLGITKTDYQDSLDTFRLSGHYSRLLPNPAVLRWFEEHGHRYRHIVLTAVPRVAASISASWVMTHFGAWIRTFHFVPTPRSSDSIPAYESSKAEYLKWLGLADVFIDDNPGSVREVRSLGIRSYLTSRPWNGGGMDIDLILESLVNISET
jgi:hypothetical protein